jgi:negative regulator of replication initiation
MKKKKTAKTQITVRIDQQLMTYVREMCEEKGISQADVAERALELALAEAKHHTPLWTKQVRNAGNRATKEQQEMFRGLLIRMVEHEVADKDSHVFTPEYALLKEACFKYLLLQNDKPYAVEALESYTRRSRHDEPISPSDY